MKKLNFLFLFLICLFAYQTYEAQNFTVTTCSTGVSSNTYGPMNSNSTANSKNRTAFILPASQLSALGGGTLTGTYFRRLATSGSLPAGTTFKIYLKNTTITDFGSSAPDWATEISTATLVYDSDPAAAVGFTSGFKQFAHSANFTYNAGSNLAVYLEYTQTTAPSTSITWDYEYGTTCISTSNNNTTKYLNTTGTFGATLTSSNYRRPVIGFDVTYPPAVAAPACTTISAPSANAINVSVTPTFTWASVLGQNGASSYTINLGTTPGGTDVMNGIDVGNVTSYTIPSGTPLNFNQQYYLTVIPKNAIGSATGCTERSFTTGNIGCPSVTAPVSAATGVSLTPTITWNAIVGATGYRISMGTTSGGTDILNNVDVGNVTTYTLGSALNTSTTYYYTVNAYNGGATSASCTVRNFTTVCSAFTPNYTNNFASFPGACWTLANGGTPATGPGTGTTNYWAVDGFLNSGSTGAAKINLYYFNQNGWLISPVFDLSAGGYRVKFDFGATNYNATTAVTAMGADDMVQFVVSTDGGATWTVLQTWDNSNIPSNTSNTFILNLTSYTGNNTKFAFFGTDGSVDDTQDYEFFADNFIIEPIPSCSEPGTVTPSAITTSSANIAWIAPSNAPANGYEIYYSTANTAPTAATTPSITGITGLSQPLGSLSPATTYYVWVRSNCSSGDKSAWSTMAMFTTVCVAATAISENFDTTTVDSLPVCWNSIGTNTTYARAYASSAMSAPNALYIYNDGTSNGIGMVSLPAVTNLQSGNYTLKFKGRANFTAGGVVEVGYLTNPSDTSTFVMLGSYTASSTTTIDNYSLDITGVPAGVNNLVLRHKGVPANSVLIDDVSYQINSSLAANEVKGSTKDGVKLYPNPFAEVLNISDVSNVKNVLVTDFSGRLVKTIANPGKEIHLGELKQGVYLVILEMKDGSKQTIKAIKK